MLSRALPWQDEVKTICYARMSGKDAYPAKVPQSASQPLPRSAEGASACHHLSERRNEALESVDQRSTVDVMPPILITLGAISSRIIAAALQVSTKSAMVSHSRMSDFLLEKNLESLSPRNGGEPKIRHHLRLK